MFTGIVEETGVISSVHRTTAGIRLEIRALRSAEGVQIGNSISVNGCCLTVVGLSEVADSHRLMAFDLLEETWARTSFVTLQPGHSVNLERSLPVGGRLGGHFVTGHIDGTGTILRWERQGADHLLDISAPDSIRPQLVPKGSIAVDGISLTIAAVNPDGFRIWIIPHTHQVTALREKMVGDQVNLEADLLGKYVARILELRR